jgi:isocitrate/isopropylmalate dehydrogenase
VGEGTPVFEPVHGSAPDIEGKGIANPVGALLSAAMMLDHLGQSLAAQRLRDAVHATLASGVCTPDLSGKATTREMTGAVRQRLARKLFEQRKA